MQIWKYPEMKTPSKIELLKYNNDRYDRKPVIILVGKTAFTKWPPERVKLAHQSFTGSSAGYRF